MTKHFGYAADLSNSISTTSQFDEFIGVTRFSHGTDAPLTISDAINNTDNSIDNTDHVVGITGFSPVEDLVNASGYNADQPAVEDSTTTSGDDQANGQQYLVASSAIDSAGLLGKNDDKIVENYSSVGDGVKNDHLTGIFDHSDNLNFGHLDNGLANSPLNNDHLTGMFDQIDSLNFNFGHFDNSSPGLANSPLSGASSHSPSFEPPGMDSAGVPDVSSEAKGHGSGGSGGSGGTTPAPYTTNSGTDVNIHVTYDSSVGSAPAGFTSVVQKVADFFASSLQDSTPITINIDVGYGEVDGTRLGFGALGESSTNLQQVSYSQLTSAYSTTGLSLGSSVPSGNLYVSYAEAKALNIGITSPLAVDGYVGFDSQSSIFDYNNVDGVSSTQYDFYGVVAHEFSEVMGRILLVGGNINNAPSYTAYDLFHFSSPGVQDFSGNGGYFSNDKGTTNLATFNNPSNGGDAGDWANTGTSNSGGSIYDAFNAFDTAGHVEPVSNTDLLALHALGYLLHA
jgi:hypothetical protein